MQPKERIEELVKILNQANVDYYLHDNPILTDNEYDSLLMELFRLEEEYPEYKLPESPTSTVGTKVLDSFAKITHGTPMFSLADVFNEEEIEAFVKRVEKEYDYIKLKGKTYYIKFDKQNKLKELLKFLEPYKDPNGYTLNIETNIKNNRVYTKYSINFDKVEEYIKKEVG